jgi:hypothetical protein
MTNLLVEIPHRSGRYRLLAGNDPVQCGDMCLWNERDDAWATVDRGSPFIGMTPDMARTAFARREPGR